MPEIKPAAGDHIQIQIQTVPYTASVLQYISAAVIDVSDDKIFLKVDGTTELRGSVKTDDYTWHHKQGKWVTKALTAPPSTSRAGETPAEDASASAPSSREITSGMDGNLHGTSETRVLPG